MDYGMDIDCDLRFDAELDQKVEDDYKIACEGADCTECGNPVNYCDCACPDCGEECGSCICDLEECDLDDFEESDADNVKVEVW